MAKKLYEETNIQDIANAIREQNGTQNQYTVAQMPAAVRAIHSQSQLETLNADHNGDYVPGIGMDGFSSVHVNVPSITPVLQEKTATVNGIVTPDTGYDGLSKVTVNVNSGLQAYPAIKVRTYSTGNNDAALKIQVGHIAYGYFVADENEIILNYKQAGSAIEYGNLISIRYSNPNWTLTSIDSVRYNDTDYPANTVLQNWSYTANIDAIISSQNSIAINGIPIIMKEDWAKMTIAQKQMINLCIIQTSTEGFTRGRYVNGQKYNEGSVSLLYTGTNTELDERELSLSVDAKLIVIAFNSEASTKDLPITVTLDNSELTPTATKHHSYTGSAPNVRNYRISQFDIPEGEHNLTINLSLNNRYSSFVYAIVDSDFTTLSKEISIADNASSGVYTSDSMVIYGTFNGGYGGTISVDYYDEDYRDTILTANPGTSYKSSYIFWFT